MSALFKKLSLLTVCLLWTIGSFAQGASANHLLQSADSLFQKQEWKLAKQKYMSYLKDTSVNSLAWNRLGYCNQNLAMYDEALKDYQKSINNNPTPFVTAIVSQRAARIYAIQNKIGEATDWLLRAGGTGYDIRPDVDTMADFKNVRQSANFNDVKKKIFASIYPCSAEPRAHDFDFWVGEWDVYQTGTKNVVGHSIVQNIAGDCALLENWTSTRTHNGKSFNYYDPTVGKWEQDWLGSSGPGERVRYINGEYKDGVMVFTHEGVDARGNKSMGIFKFYNVDKNTVRQYLETSLDGGKTYRPVYDFTYVRKAGISAN